MPHVFDRPSPVDWDCNWSSPCCGPEVARRPPSTTPPALRNPRPCGRISPATRHRISTLRRRFSEFALDNRLRGSVHRRALLLKSCRSGRRLGSPFDLERSNAPVQLEGFDAGSMGHDAAEDLHTLDRAARLHAQRDGGQVYDDAFDERPALPTKGRDAAAKLVFSNGLAHLRPDWSGRCRHRYAQRRCRVVVRRQLPAAPSGPANARAICYR
jgi:hypothetical protein